MESFAEKVARLQREIAERQAELVTLICGDPRTVVTLPPATCTTVRGPYEGKDSWPA